MEVEGRGDGEERGEAETRTLSSGGTIVIDDEMDEAMCAPSATVHGGAASTPVLQP